MAVKSSIVPDVFDAELLAVVQQLIPPERLHVHLEELERQFRMMMDPTSSDASLEGLAHKIVSQAGMLGLTRMAECARKVENACRIGRGRQIALLHCCSAVTDIRLYGMPAVELLAATSPQPEM